MKKTVFVISFICFFSCAKSKESNQALQQALNDFHNIENKHNVQSDILSVLEHFQYSKTLESKQTDTKTTVTDGDFRLTFKNNVLTNVKSSVVSYEINDVNTIDVFYLKGEKTRKGSLSDGIYDGIYITKHKDEVLKEVHLNKGDSILFKETYKNGNLKREIKYSAGIRTGIDIEFHPNKTKKIETHYHNGLKEGVYQEWFDSGKLKTRVMYQKGNKEGEQKVYYKDTQTMQFKTFYKNGKKEGLEIAWYINTKPKYKVFYKTGKLEGEAILYQENKELMKMKGNYANDLRNGNFIIWNEEGQVLFSGNYEFGELLKTSVGTEEGDSNLFDLEDIFY